MLYDPTVCRSFPLSYRIRKVVLANLLMMPTWVKKIPNVSFQGLILYVVLFMLIASSWSVSD